MPGASSTTASHLAVIVANSEFLDFLMAEASQLLADEATDQRVVPDIKNQYVALEDLRKGVEDLVLHGQATIRAGQASIQKGYNLIQHGNFIFLQVRDLRDEISLQMKEIFEGRRSSLDISGRSYINYTGHRNDTLDEDAHCLSQMDCHQESRSGPSTSSSFDFINDAHVPHNYASNDITIDRAASPYLKYGPSRSDRTASEENGNGRQRADATARNLYTVSDDHAIVDQGVVADHHNVMSIASLIDPSLCSETPPETISQDTVQPSNPKSLKREFPDPGLAGNNKKLKGDQDPENLEIYQLRNKENKGFEEVAKIMNKRRLEIGKTAKFTSNAIYSRYKRNAGQIAAALSESFKPCQADVDAGTAFFLQTVATDFDSQDDDLLLRAYASIHKDMFKLVSQKLQDLGGRVHTPQMCADRLNQLGYK